MIPNEDIRYTIEELEKASQQWVDGNYTAIANLFRAQIKGLHYALGEDYNIKDGKVTSVSKVKSEAEIRSRIAEIEETAKEYEDQENVIRLMRAQIKGLKLTLGEPYVIAEGK